jgi:hypothetical protein
VFRDDLKAAVARAEQLERDLTEAEARAKAAEAENEQLRGKLRFTERELDQLRRKRPDGPPREVASSSRRRAALLLGAIALVLLTAGGVGAFLLAKRSPAPDKPTAIAAPAAPTIARPESSGSFESFVRHVRHACKVARSGYLGSCKLKQQLVTAEARVGAQNAAMVYCKLLDDRDQGLAAMVADRLRYFYTHKLEALDASAFRCLDRYIRGNGRHRHQVIEIWAQLGTRLGHRQAIATFLRSAPAKLQRPGLKGLWTYGRLDVLPELRRYLRSSDREQVRAALRALTSVRDDKERAAVCPLIATIAKQKDADLRSRARATYTLGMSCRKSHAAFVLDSVDRVIVQARQDGEQLDYWWIAALSALGRRYAKPTLQTKRRALALARRVINDRAVSPLRRAQALRVLREIDAQEAWKQARKLRDSKPTALRKAARRILER